MVEVTQFERNGGAVHLLHLVNGSGHRGISCVEPVTMHGVDVGIPYEGEPSGAAGLVSGRELEWRAEEGLLTVHVPELRLFEAIRIAR
jgi:hypothetical protein